MMRVRPRQWRPGRYVVTVGPHEWLPGAGLLAWLANSVRLTRGPFGAWSAVVYWPLSRTGPFLRVSRSGWSEGEANEDNKT